MTLSDLLKKLKSNDKRDALARTWWTCENRIESCDCLSEKPFHPKFNPFEVIDKAGYDARTKDVELLVALCELAIKQRDEWACVSNYIAPHLDNLIADDNKELAEMAEKMMKEGE